MKINNPSGLNTIDYRKVKPLQGNLKDLSDENGMKLKGVLERRGFEVPLFIWFEDATPWLIDGHQRHRVMTKFDMHDDGNYEVPFIKVEAETKKEAKAKLLEISSQFGHITYEGFDEFAADLPMAEVVEAVSFDALPLLGQDQEEPPEDDPPPISSQPAVSQRGEIYQLGEHRLMCGDATSAEDVGRLTDGTEVDLIFTDPPYNVALGYDMSPEEAKRLNRRTDGKTVENDGFESDDEYRKFLGDAFRNMAAASKKGAAIYVCHPDWYSHLVRLAFIEGGWELKQTIVWVKNALVMGRQDYQWKHEPILYGWQAGAAHYFVDDRKQTTVWEHDRPTSSREHPTMKPVGLVSRAVKNSSKQGDIVLDLFGGAGSTLVACQYLERRCFTMELDPKYCDVIRKRYAEVTEQEDWEAATPVAGGKQEA